MCSPALASFASIVNAWTGFAAPTEAASQRRESQADHVHAAQAAEPEARA